jgi:hypothetical protein
VGELRDARDGAVDRERVEPEQREYASFKLSRKWVIVLRTPELKRVPTAIHLKRARKLITAEMTPAGLCKQIDDRVMVEVADDDLLLTTKRHFQTRSPSKWERPQVRQDCVGAGTDSHEPPVHVPHKRH